MLAVFPYALYYKTPAFVRVNYTDGDSEELAFPTRRDAETFVWLIPFAQVNSDNDYWRDIVSAIIVPALISLN